MSLSVPVVLARPLLLSLAFLLRLFYSLIFFHMRMRQVGPRQLVLAFALSDWEVYSKKVN